MTGSQEDADRISWNTVTLAELHSFLAGRELTEELAGEWALNIYSEVMKQEYGRRGNPANIDILTENAFTRAALIRDLLKTIPRPITEDALIHWTYSFSQASRRVSRWRVARDVGGFLKAAMSRRLGQR